MSKHRITFDVETGPQDASYLLAKFNPVFEAGKNLKDPEKIANEIAEKKREWLEKSALYPERGEVLAIGWKEDGGKVFLLEGNESAILSDIFDILKQIQPVSSKAKYEMSAGFNILNFDLPFLRKRALILGVPCPIYARANKWEPWGVCKPFDAMLDYNCGDRRAFTSLDTVAIALGLGGKDATTGKRFSEVYKTDPEKAREYLRRDVDLTDAVVERLLA
jgi:hypothetical protein